MGRTLILGSLAALTVAGCGSGTSILPGHSSSRTRTTAAAAGRPADPEKVAVVVRWSEALRRGDVHGAARYFHLPSVFVDGSGPALRIRNLAQAELANAALPCGAKFISAKREGPFINVLFRLTTRAGRGGGPNACGTGVGRTARTNFIIRGGQIIDWVRAPDEPGDGGSGTGTAPTTPTAPGGTATI